MKYMSIVRDLASRSGNWRFYDKSFRKLREVDPLPWGRTHSEIWLRAHKVTKPGAQTNFRPKQGVSTTPGVTALHSAQVPSVMVAPSSTPASNAGVATLSHDAHKLDHGKNQANLMNPQILPTPVIAANYPII